MLVDTTDQVEPLCPACEDSGWMTKFCDGTHDVICGRTRKHLPHGFAVPCGCRAMNRNYQERVQRYVRSA